MQNLSHYELKDVFAFVSVLIAITALFNPWFVAYLVNWVRTKKSLTFHVGSVLPIVTINSTKTDKIDVLYNGVSIRDGQVYTFSFKNSGQVPINASDFEKTLDVLFASDAIVLTSEVSSCKPSDLVIIHQTINNKIRIEPLLLNPADSFEISGVVRTLDPKISCSSRISGIPRISERRPKSPIDMLEDFYSMIPFFGFALFIIIRVSDWILGRDSFIGKPLSFETVFWMFAGMVFVQLLLRFWASKYISSNDQ